MLAFQLHPGDVQFVTSHVFKLYFEMILEILPKLQKQGKTCKEKSKRLERIKFNILF